ncbi:universal stress protein [Streptomyces sp. HNM0575]|uniref:universal stress protein n=1 Tax=Streptomyces sp. HNM0575 TaxID=2716338 RepID=UPI00145E1CA4|nr:universal stress protein [Streptomyces sp. HNM0575]NLU75702.1 universal stress protein [Streptomyces sp. HNM0575]
MTEAADRDRAGRSADRRPVAVGVDGSAESLAAVEWAGADAVSRDVPLWIVCARRKSHGPGEWEPWPQDQLHAAHRLAAELYPSLAITEDAVCDSPVKALMAAGGEAALLVLGSRGLGSVEGYVLGSVGLSVIAHSRRPVVAVRGRMPAGAAAETGPVVAGVDLHDGHEEVLGFAFRTASAQKRTLRVAHAWSVRHVYSYPSALPDPRITAQAGADSERALERLLTPWRERFPEVDTEIRCEGEAVAPYLLQVASDAAVLAVGRRLRGHPFPTRVGPVVHALLHHSARPVAVVPHG